MYPDAVDNFSEKLNKLDNNTYVIEEEVNLIDGIYEDYLKHDNVDLNSINVYTGTKLTGEKLTNFLVSTPSKMPWKKIIKIFANLNKVYVTYETQGDTVEAEDINKLQDSVVNTQIELNRYKKDNDLAVLSLKDRATILENGKAEKVYVDTELNKRYLKTDVYTKTETDQRIKDVVGTAPEALDTLQEIANSLNNDNDFAGTMTLQLSNKVDKVEGKQLSTEDYTTAEKTKLVGIESGANKYIHPSSHAATMITEDSTHRFVTDIDKANWNDGNSKKHTHNNLSLLETITQSLIDAWNGAYTHISDAVKHITSAERTLWNTVSNKVDKVTGKNLSTNDFDNNYKSKIDGVSLGANKVENSATNGNIKIDGVEKNVYVHPSGTNPHGTTKTDIGLGNVSNDSQVKRSEMGVINGVATLDPTGKVVQQPPSHTHDDRYYTESEADLKFATKSEIGNAGYGDMLKSVYDTNGDGTVDKAEKLTNAILISDYNTLVPIKITQGSITPIKATSSANSPWNNTTSGFLIQSNDADSFHVVIFRSGGDGWAYRSYYQGTWASWKIWSTFDGNYNNLNNKPTIPTTLPANGGNADTVDGKHASDFAFSGIGDTDLNTITSSGMYRINNSLSNAPSGVDHGQLLVIHGGGDTITQIVTDYSSGNIYWRSGNPLNSSGNGTWKSWRKIWHEGNDGAGSGLDADLLDGKHASDFMSKGPITWSSLKGV